VCAQLNQIPCSTSTARAADAGTIAEVKGRCTACQLTESLDTKARQGTDRRSTGLLVAPIHL
jgi:hypothetical protein